MLNCYNLISRSCYHASLELHPSFVSTDFLFQVAEYMQKIDALEERFRQRSSDFQRMQGELKTIKHYRKIKANLEEDLISVLHSYY